jgi:Zn-dependent peptidase ImmA (M78 family)
MNMAVANDRIVEKLLGAGFSQDLVDASLPDWWNHEEQSSTSARTLVSLLLARRLSLDPATLLDDNLPLGFLHTGPTKFKHMRLAPGDRREALVAFSQGVSRILLSAVEQRGSHAIPTNAAEFREQLLAPGRPYVSFGDVLAACWAVGVPVLHLRVFPARAKGVTAIAVRLGERHAILVARETGAEAQYMFHVAHELGHIALGHLNNIAAIVDADPHDPQNKLDELIDDEEERAADEYAQALLTGAGNFSVVRNTFKGSTLGSPSELAKLALNTGNSLQVDPGHIVMCFGYSTGDWGLAMSAIKLLPAQKERPATLVNRVLWGQLDPSFGDTQAFAYLRAVAPI